MTKKTQATEPRPLHAQLAELNARVDGAKQRVREVDGEVRAAAAEVERATDSVVEAYADGQDAKAEKLAAARGQAEREVVRLREEKLAGVQRAATRAEVDRQRFVTENCDGLLAEVRRDAEAVTAAVDEAITAIGTARQAWGTIEAEVMALLRAAGRETGSLPRFPQPLEDLVRQAARVGVEVPLPLPLPPVAGPAIALQPPPEGLEELARPAPARFVDGERAA